MVVGGCSGVRVDGNGGGGGGEVHGGKVEGEFLLFCGVGVGLMWWWEDCRWEILLCVFCVGTGMCVCGDDDDNSVIGCDGGYLVCRGMR